MLPGIPQPPTTASTSTSTVAPAGTKRPAASDLQRSTGSATAGPSSSSSATAQTPSSKRHATRPASSIGTAAAGAGAGAGATMAQQMPPAAAPQPLPAGPPAITEEQLMGRSPEQLIQTILQIQANHQQYVASISQQYENIMQQLNELRASLAAFYNGQAASHQAAASQLQMSPQAYADPSSRLTRPGVAAASSILPPTSLGAPRPPTTALPPNTRSQRPGPVSPQTTHGDARLLPKQQQQAQPAAAAAASSSMQQAPPHEGTVGPPVYDYRTVGTVEEVWREYREGMDGQPAIEQLDAQWGSRWRPEPRGRTWYSRRKVIWDKIKEYIADGMDEEDAVREVEKLRDGGTINKLIRTLQDERKEKGGGDEGLGS